MERIAVLKRQDGILQTSASKLSLDVSRVLFLGIGDHDGLIRLQMSGYFGRVGGKAGWSVHE